MATNLTENQITTLIAEEDQKTNSRLYTSSTDNAIQTLLTTTLLDSNVKTISIKKKWFQNNIIVTIYNYSISFTLKNYKITLTNMLDNSTIFTFLNIKISTFTIIVNIIISSRNKILIISINILIFLIYIDYNKSYQKIKQKIPKETQLAMHENNNHNNVNIVNYWLNRINQMTAGMEGYELIQIDAIIILSYVFVYDTVNNAFDNENELEFEFQNETIDCGDFFNGMISFNNGFDYSALSPPKLFSTPAPRPIIFNFNGTVIGLHGNDVLECIFSANNDQNNNIDGEMQRTTIRIVKQKEKQHLLSNTQILGCALWVDYLKKAHGYYKHIVNDFNTIQYDLKNANSALTLMSRDMTMGYTYNGYNIVEFVFNGIGFDCNVNTKNFYNNAFDCGVLLPPTPSPRPVVFIVNGTGILMPESIVLACIFGANVCKYGFVNEINEECVCECYLY